MRNNVQSFTVHTINITDSRTKNEKQLPMASRSWFWFWTIFANKTYAHHSTDSTDVPYGAFHGKM